MTVLDQLEELKQAIENGDERAADLATSIVADIQLDAASWKPAEREVVYGRLQNLISAAQEQRELTRDQIRSAGQSKRAIAGYGQLRPSRRSQRTNKQA
jgi:hypothetical protein